MLLFINVRLFNSPFTVCYIAEEFFMLPDEASYKSIGVNIGDTNSYIKMNNNVKSSRKKLKASALLLQPFVKECMYSEAFRVNALKNLNRFSGSPNEGVLFLKLILEPPDKEIIDYSWNHKMLRLIWTRVEIENAFAWLSTLGGAYSALGDYFDHCAEEAGKISERQYKLSQMLGDEGLAERSRLYSALAYAQKGNLKLARHIVRRVAAFSRDTQDVRLNRMCQGVWAKLKYMRRLRKANQTASIGKSGDNTTTSRSSDTSTIGRNGDNICTGINCENKPAE